MNKILLAFGFIESRIIAFLLDYIVALLLFRQDGPAVCFWWAVALSGVSTFRMFLRLRSAGGWTALQKLIASMDGAFYQTAGLESAEKIPFNSIRVKSLLKSSWVVVPMYFLLFPIFAPFCLYAWLKLWYALTSRRRGSSEIRLFS